MELDVYIKSFRIEKEKLAGTWPSAESQMPPGVYAMIAPKEENATLLYTLVFASRV